MPLSYKVLACFMLLFCPNLFAQTASQKSVSETCDCVKKIDASLNEDQRTQSALNCMALTTQKYMPQLKEELHITEKDEKAAGMAVGRNLGTQLFQQCPEMAGYLMKLAARQNQANSASSGINPDTMMLDRKVCLEYRKGKYKSSKLYINRNAIENPDKSAFAEIKDGYIYDYANNQSSTTKWMVKYPSECTWEETLVESNDENINSVFKKGDKIIVNVIGSTKEGGLWLSSKMMGMEFIVLINKIP